MREIEGFIALGKVSERVPGKTQEVAFGQGIGKELYQAIKTNGLNPFVNIEGARLAAEELAKRNLGFTEISLARIKMRVAEDEKDLSNIQGGNSYVVLAMGEDNTVNIIGEPLESGHTPFHKMQGALVDFNDWKPFKVLDDAFWTASEAKRQMESLAQIATLEFERVK